MRKCTVWADSVARINRRTGLPCPQTDLSHGICDRTAKDGVTVQDRDARLNLRDPPVKILRHQLLAQQLHTIKLCLGAASAVVSALILTECPTQILRCAQRIVSGDCTGVVWLPWQSIAAWRNDRVRTAVSDGVVAAALVVCAISSHTADLPICRSADHAGSG